MIKKFLIPNSITKLAVRLCVFGKDSLCLNLVELSRLLVVVAKPDKKKKSTRTKKRCSALVWLDSEYLVQTYKLLHCFHETMTYFEFMTIFKNCIEINESTICDSRRMICTNILNIRLSSKQKTSC